MLLLYQEQRSMRQEGVTEVYEAAEVYEARRGRGL